MPQSPPRSRRILKRLLLAAAVLVAADQLLLYTALSSDHLAGRYLAPFDPPLFTPVQRERLRAYRALIEEDSLLPGLTAFDGELGWCPRPDHSRGNYSYDAHGCRLGGSPLTTPKPAGVRRIVTLGCSFTHGDEVRGEETWAAQLDRLRPDLEVANLGVGGYGIDQAWLRWRRDAEALEPDEVWLGLCPATSWRVVTCYAPACRHWTQMVFFKPRFLLGEGDALELQRSPAPDLDTLVHLLSDQEAFLAETGESDWWVRRAPRAYAPRGTSILHWSALGRLGLTAAEARGREPARWLRDPQSELHRVTRAVILAAREEAALRGVPFRLLVLPSRGGLRSLSAGRPAYWGPLVEALRGEGVVVHDLTTALLDAGLDEDPRGWQPQGHYSPRANRMVAETLSSLF